MVGRAKKPLARCLASKERQAACHPLRSTGRQAQGQLRGISGLRRHRSTAPSGTPAYHVDPTRPTDLAWRGDTPAGARRLAPAHAERLDEEELADWRAGHGAGVSAPP